MKANENPEENEIIELVDNLKNNNINSLISKATELISNYPNSYVLLSILAAGYTKIADHDSAFLSKGNKIKFWNKRVIYKFRQSYIQLKKFQSALDNYSLASNIDPNCDITFTKLGVAHGELNNLEKAKSCLLKALKINPNNLESRFNLGMIKLKLLDYAEALIDFDLVNSKRSRFYSLICLHALKKYEEFEFRIKKNINVDKKNIRVSSVSNFLANILID